jgi:hypothetical protein
MGVEFRRSPASNECLEITPPSGMIWVRELKSAIMLLQKNVLCSIHDDMDEPWA